MDEKTIRTLEEFANELAKQIERGFFEGYGLFVEAESHPVMKTNVEKQGITVHFKDSNVAPTVYADEAYQQYLDGDVSIPEVAEKMCEGAYEAHKRTPELPELTPEEARKHITLTLVNTEKNQQLLDKTPHFDVLDGELSAIPRWYLDENASFVVSNDMCGTLGLTSDEVLMMGQQHINNQHFEAKSMKEVLSEMMGGDYMEMMPPMDGPELIVVTSESRMQGSNSLLQVDILDQVHDRYGDFAVLPSSVHEILCLPITSEMKPEDLRAMVCDVNASQVALEEQLSNEIFMYDGHKLSLVRDSFAIEPKITPTLEGYSMRMVM